MTATKKSFAPLVGNDPTVLILGSLPGDKSLQKGEYYAHKSNRFWPLMARLLGELPSKTYEEKTQMLLKHRIALWDVVRVANRNGSSDAKIANEEPNDLTDFLRLRPSIKVVAFNGKKAEDMFKRHLSSKIEGVRFVTLLSTSPANCQYNEGEMLQNWMRILEDSAL